MKTQCAICDKPGPSLAAGGLCDDCYIKDVENFKDALKTKLTAAELRLHEAKLSLHESKTSIERLERDLAFAVKEHNEVELQNSRLRGAYGVLKDACEALQSAMRHAPHGPTGSEWGCMHPLCYALERAEEILNGK